MKQTGMIKRLISAVLLLAMAVSILPAGAAGEEAKQYGYLVINNTTQNRVVNFRRHPNTNDNTNYPIARLPEYWVVEVLGSTKVGNQEWKNIKANINITGGTPDYRTGFVMDGFVKLMTAQEQVEWMANQTATFNPAAPKVTPTPTPTSAPTGSGSTPTPAPGSALGFLRTVVPKVNMREVPGGKVINDTDQIPINYTLAYYALIPYDGYDWALVQYNGKSGYIRSDCYMRTDNGGTVAPITEKPTSTPAPTAGPTGVSPDGKTYGRVTENNVFFRRSMSTSGDFWCRLPAGWMLEVQGQSTVGKITWYKVKGGTPANPTRTYTGYIHGDFFEIVENGATAAPTAMPGQSNYGLVTLNGINLRQTPGGTAKTALLADTVVVILARPAGNTSNDWYYVWVGGMDGYLPATAMRTLLNSELGSYTLPQMPTATPTPNVPGPGGYVKLIKDKVNIRKTPAGTVLTPTEKSKMPVGTLLSYSGSPVAASGYNWVLVTYNGITGYVRSDCYQYCDDKGNPIAGPSAPTPTPTPYIPGMPTSEPTDTPSGVTQGYIKLIKGGVNLRRAPWGQTYGQLDKGTVLPYFNIRRTNNTSSEEWYEVYSSKLGTFGFILKTMAQLCDVNGNPLSPEALPTANPATIVGYVATKASSVWLRVTPTANADTAGQVKKKGTVLPQIGPSVITDYEWFPVQTADGTRAYLRGDFVFALADWQLDLYNNTGVLATPTPGPATPKPGNSSYIKTTADKLWVRETPSRQAGTLGQLSLGTVIRFNKTQVVGKGTSSETLWYQIYYGNGTGWVMGNYVRVLSNAEYEALKGTATPAPSATPTKVIDPTQLSDLALTTAERVRIRADKNMSSKELYMVYDIGTELTYLGNYAAPDPANNNPYYWFNVRYNGITGWMCGDFVRVLTKTEKEIYKKSGNPDTPQPAVYRTLSKNMSGDDVLALQRKLIEKGYLAEGQDTGVYLSSTENAVINFQKDANLTVDGIAGAKTQHALFGTVDPDDPSGNGSSVSVKLNPVEKIDWFNGGIQSIWYVGSVAIITDVYTGISFQAQRLYGDNHADCEPLTTADTAAYCRIYGVSKSQEIEDREQELQSYRRRPLWVTIGNRTFCASMYGIPHNYAGDRIPDNGYTGQFCVHFTGSKTHGSGKLPAQVDPDASYNNYFGHQSAIEYAYNHSISGNK